MFMKAMKIAPSIPCTQRTIALISGLEGLLKQPPTKQKNLTKPRQADEVL